MLTLILFVGKQIADAIPVSRPSPTLVYPDALRLSLLVPDIRAKDFAYDAFPGDHALVLLLCAGVFTYFLPRAHAVAAWFLALVFSIPRLVGGGHWLTDIIVGSVSVALLVLSWALATPLHRVMTDMFERGVSRIRHRLKTRIP
jgi:membrane-associated phospholipid phosphatase